MLTISYRTRHKEFIKHRALMVTLGKAESIARASACSAPLSAPTLSQCLFSWVSQMQPLPLVLSQLLLSYNTTNSSTLSSGKQLNKTWKKAEQTESIKLPSVLPNPGALRSPDTKPRL